MNSAGNAVGAAGEAAEEAGAAIAVIGSTVEEVGKQVISILAEAEELITIKRLTRRSESDLWEEEKERLEGLKSRKDQLMADLDSLGVPDPSDYSFDMASFFKDPTKTMRIMRLISNLAAVNNEIREIWYQEPGVLSTAIYNASETLERFNTIEQPKIEGIMDVAQDTLEVSEETIAEIKKLFSVKRLVPVLDAELTADLRTRLGYLDGRRSHILRQIDRQGALSDQLNLAMSKMPASAFDITEKGIRIKGLTTKETIFSHGQEIAVGRPSGPSPPSLPGGLRTDRPAGGIAGAATAAASAGTAAQPLPAAAKGAYLPLLSRNAMLSGKAIPQGARVSAMLNTRFDGYLRAFDSTQARLGHYDRQMALIDKKIQKIKFKTVEEPGIIPRILDEVHAVLGRVKTQEQPKIDKALDTLDQTLMEAKSLVGNANRSLSAAGGTLSFLSRNAAALKVAAGVFGAVLFLDLFFGLIMLVKMTFGI